MRPPARPSVRGGACILHTADGGATWTVQHRNTTRSLVDVHFTDTASGWAAGPSSIAAGVGFVYHTTDGGQVWTSEPSGTTNALLGIDFIDVDNGWISGEGGTILRYTGGSTGTAVEDVPEAGPPIVLEQNYPNPFRTATTIRFQVERPGAVRLQVYDLLGRRVATLVDGHHVAGVYTIEWSAASEAAGVYVYRLQVDGRAEMQKMVLLR